MATMTKSEIADLVLENLGVKAVEQSANATHSALAQKAIDTAHDQLRKRALAPYELTAVPEWAQIPLRDFVTMDLAGTYGITGERLQLAAANRKQALAEMAAQVSSLVQLPTAKAKYY